MQTFVISPSDQVAGVLNDADEMVRFIAPAAQAGTTIPVTSYLSRYPSTTIVAADSEEEALGLFEESKDSSTSLDFTLLLFNEGTSLKTRSKAAKVLNELLEYPRNNEHVLDILLAETLPSSADIKGAIRSAKPFTRTLALVQTIVDSQSRVSALYDSWKSLSLNSDLLSRVAVSAQELRGLFLREGVFRKLVLNGKSKNDKPRLTGQVVLPLQHLCDVKVTGALVNGYFAHLPARPAVFDETRIAEEYEEVVSNSSLKQTAKVKYEGADVKRERAEKQVERIVSEFGLGNDQSANEYLTQLIDSQTKGGEEHSHVVKSLCNIASKLRVHGRQDISFQCLLKAMEFKGGIDAVLYQQIGNAFRDIWHFDQAVSCFEMAKKLDKGDHLEAIDLDLIRVDADKGKYDVAIASLESQVEHILYPKKHYGLLGKLQRWMGNLSDAKASYRHALKLDNRYHQALAGLAEAEKQGGKHYKAIQRYQGIFTGFPELDEGSVKVYYSALSRLYRITQQPKQSLNILNGLQKLYPVDPDIHLQLAKLHMVMGDTAKARLHFGRAESRNVEKIAAALFKLSDGQQVYELPNPDDPQNVSGVMPDQKGLLKCSRAMVAIKAHDYQTAQRMVSGGGFNDRFQRDFGSVLKFHAVKKIEPSFNYKSDQNLCRIAKRGHRVLRQTITVIAADDFESAQTNELKLCCLVG